MSFRCEPCCMSFTGSVPYQGHLLSSKHEKKVKNFQSVTMNSEHIIKSMSNDHIKKIHESEYVCCICNIKLNSSQQAEIHVNGQKHIRLLQNKNLWTPSIEAGKVSSSELTNFQEKIMLPFSSNVIDKDLENAMSGVKIFDIDDTIYF